MSEDETRARYDEIKALAAEVVSKLSAMSVIDREMFFGLVTDSYKTCGHEESKDCWCDYSSPTYSGDD